MGYPRGILWFLGTLALIAHSTSCNGAEAAGFKPPTDCLAYSGEAFQQCLYAMIEQQTETIAQLREELHEKDTTIGRLQNELTARSATTEQLQAELGQRDQQIQNLQSQTRITPFWGPPYPAIGPPYLGPCDGGFLYPC